MPIRTWAKNFYTLNCNLINTALADGTYYPASGSFIDVGGFERFVFLIEMGTTNTAATWTVYQDTSATATGSLAVLSNTASIVTAAGDSNKWVTIEVTTNQLSAGFHYVTLYCSGGGAMGGNDYAAITFIGYRARHTPVTQPTGYANTALTCPVEIVG